MPGGSLQVSGDGFGPVTLPTPDEARRATVHATEAAMAGGWEDDLPDVLAALGLVETVTAAKDPLGRPYVPSRVPGGRRSNDETRTA